MKDSTHPETWKVGDVITIDGPSVPDDLKPMFFRVEEIEKDSVRLSQPYHDAALTTPYHPKVEGRQTRAKVGRRVWTCASCARVFTLSNDTPRQARGSSGVYCPECRGAEATP